VNLFGYERLGSLMKLDAPDVRVLYVGLPLVLFSLVYLFPSPQLIRGCLLSIPVVVLAVVIPTFSQRWLRYVATFLFVLVFNLNSRVSNAGDSSWLELSTRSDQSLFGSSLGAHSLLRYLSTHELNLSLISPLCGALVSIVMLFGAEEKSLAHELRRPLSSAAVVLGCLPLFSFGFIEVTQIAFPIGAASMLTLGGFSSTVTRSKMRILFSGCLSGLGLVVHGVILLVIVSSLFRILLLKRFGITRFALYLVGLTVPIVTTFVIVKATHTDVVAGDARGGGDNRMLPTDLFSFQRLIVVFAICICISLFVIPWLFELIRGGFTGVGVSDLIPLSVFPGFILLWNLDLGISRDLDLVYASSLVCLWIPKHFFRSPTSPLLYLTPFSLLAYAPWSMVDWKIYGLP
jgi:hypothetical protein